MTTSLPSLTRAQFLRRTAAAGTATLVPGLLAACGDDDSTSADSGTVRVLAWEGYAEPTAYKPLKDRGITVKPIPLNADDVDNIAKRGQYDIGTGIDGLFPTFVAAGIAQPLDLERIPNYRQHIEASAMLSPETGTPPLTVVDGKPYGVPFAWGTLGVSYLPSKVPSPPRTIEDLLAPSYKGQLALVDDPINLIQAVARLLGVGGTDDLGRSPAPLFLTEEELDRVFAKLEEFRAQARSIYPGYGALVNAYTRGEIIAAMPDWAPTAAAAEEGGVEVSVTFPPTSRTYIDCMFISADTKATDDAYAFLNQALSTHTQYAVGKELIVAVMNRRAMERLVKQGPGWSVYADPNEVLERAPSVEWPPAKSEEYLTFPEILKRWQQFKAAS